LDDRQGHQGQDQPEGNSHPRDRKSTRLNSSHGSISYAVFCLKKKNEPEHEQPGNRKKSGKKRLLHRAGAGVDPTEQDKCPDAEAKTLTVQEADAVGASWTVGE